MKRQPKAQSKREACPHLWQMVRDAGTRAFIRCYLCAERIIEDIGPSDEERPILKKWENVPVVRPWD